MTEPLISLPDGANDLVHEPLQDGITWSQLLYLVEEFDQVNCGEWDTDLSTRCKQALEFVVHRDFFCKVVCGSLLYGQHAPNSIKSMSVTHDYWSSNGLHQKQRQTELEKRIENTTKERANSSILYTDIPIVIHGTPLTIVVTSKGSPIPSILVGASLSGALRLIANDAKENPHVPIFQNQFWYRQGISDVWISIRGSSARHIMMWQQLSWIMSALLQWMEDGNSYEIMFHVQHEIDGQVAFGSIGHDPLPSPGIHGLEKRAGVDHDTFLRLPKNSTDRSSYALTDKSVDQPLRVMQVKVWRSELAKKAAGSVRYRNTLLKNRGILGGTSVQFSNISSIPSFVTASDSIYIPGTCLELCFRNFGDHIPSSQVVDLFNRALLNWPMSEDQLTSFHFRIPYSTVDGGISLDLQWRTALEVTYKVLYLLICTLQEYMVGSESSRSHLQDLEFEIKAFGIPFGIGKVWYVSGYQGSKAA